MKEVMVITEANVKEDIIAGMKNTITQAGGTVTEVDCWGVKSLAYPIPTYPDGRKRKTPKEGYYFVMDFEGSMDVARTLDQYLKTTLNVVRHLIINMDED